MLDARRAGPASGVGPASAWARRPHGPGFGMGPASAESAPSPSRHAERPQPGRRSVSSPGRGRPPTSALGAGNGVSCSQRQRPAALATPFEVAAQGLGLIRARHRPDQQRLPPVLDARQAAELTEQVLVLQTQLAPRGGRALGTAVLAEFDEPASGRREAEFHAVTFERDGREAATGVGVGRIIGQVRRVHAEDGGALAAVLDRRESGEIADVVLHRLVVEIEPADPLGGRRSPARP